MANADQISLRDNSLPITPSDKAADSNSGVGDFARTLAYSAIQTPVTAVSQILDKATGTNVAPNINMINKADEASFGSGRWHLQQVAAGIGALVPFVAALAFTKNISRAFEAEELALKYCGGSVASTASMFRTGEMATAGMLQGAFLEPNQNNDKFFQERLTQGITAGVTMGAMHAFSNKFSDWTGASASGASLINKSLTTGLAGGAGGFVGLETHGLLTGESLSGKDALQSVYQAAFTGAALGAIGSAQMRLHQPKSGLHELENQVARNSESEIFERSYISRHKERTTDWRSPKTEEEQRPVSPIERIEMISILHRDADPLLRQPQVMSDFIDKIRGTRSDEFQIADLNDENVTHRIDAMQTALESRPIDGESRQDVRDYSAIKRLQKKALKASDGTLDDLETAKENYRERLEVAVNEFLTKHNLPKIDLYAGDPYEFHANAEYGGARVAVNQRLLGSSVYEGELIDAVYHELTHLRQDTLRINVIADKLGLPPEPTEADIQRVKDEFDRSLLREQRGLTDNASKKSDTKSLEANRSDQLVEDVLRIRKDHPLSIADKALAERISDDVFRYQAKTEVKNLGDAKQQINEINRYLDGDSNRIITGEFFSTLANDPKQFEKYYGFKRIPPELLALAKEHQSNPLSKLIELNTPEDVDAWHAQTEYFAELKQRLEPHLVKQLDVLEHDRDRLEELRKERYYRNPLEQQAFSTGILADLSFTGSEQSSKY